MDFRLPDIGEGIAEGEIITWLVKVGDTVKEDQPLFEVMTDKATVEIPSPRAGIISKILAKEGEVVPVESVVVVIDEFDAIVKNDAKGTKNIEKNVEKNVNFVMVDNKDNLQNAFNEENNDLELSDKKVLATPATRKFARDNSVKINQLKGTGKNGKVTKDDINSHLNKKINPKTESKDLVVTGEVKSYQSNSYSYSEAGKYDEERVTFKGLRKKIAENLVKSLQHAPHFMIADEVDMTELVNYRRETKSFAEKKGVKLTYLPFIMKAVISALKDFPTLNSTLDEEKSELVLKKYYNIGFAVATTQGLIVPVIKNADKKSIFDTAKEVEILSNQTREGKVEVDNLKGGTFTISSIGSIGGLFSSPIINYPEVAIIAVNKIVERPVVKNGEFVARSMMYLSMSCDHRVVDGAVAALFLNRVIELLENPKLLLLE
ncbi:MAG: 2-oxo acid dehydrogenase subunit E2 [Candidatus Sericytochromatia bacterium]|nr:2-oxo acid dehydrogenase subunit E2 [Candidatus Sericytochromatia bacterium]